MALFGSGLWSTARAVLAHMVKPGPGALGEIFDLRKDLVKELTPMAAITVEEFTNPVGQAAPGAAVLLAATAVVEEEVVLLAADLLAAGLAQLAAWPRQLTFTTAGNTPADAPATAAIVGLNEYGEAQTETVNLAQTATIATGVKYWSAITSITYPTGQGTDATVSIGIAAAVVKKATAVSAAAVTLTATDIIQNDLALHPRALIFTTAGNTPADAPATATITGYDIHGLPLTETVALAQTATTAAGVKFFAQITSIAYPVGQGTDATVAITFSAAIGLRKKPVARAGLLAPVKEIAAGSVVTNGVVTAHTTHAPYGSYAPNSAANDARDYAVYYEYDAAA